MKYTLTTKVVMGERTFLIGETVDGEELGSMLNRFLEQGVVKPAKEKKASEKAT